MLPPPSSSEPDVQLLSHPAQVSQPPCCASGDQDSREDSSPDASFWHQVGIALVERVPGYRSERSGRRHAQIGRGD